MSFFEPTADEKKQIISEEDRLIEAITEKNMA